MRLTGPFSLNSVFDFQSASRAVTDPALIVDLTKVPYMDSAALGSILGMHCSCERQRKPFALAGASERLRTLFEVAGVDALLVSYATIEDAQEKLAPHAASAG